ncbi:MAG: EAL domain-containing protein [Desulfovibrionaceae bacterium]|jgi:diguanylate cyclase (GGDEF)-like protein|nr:EAL domain-containing protein [Desulfovibrionaceae bacterium]
MSGTNGTGRETGKDPCGLSVRARLNIATLAFLLPIAVLAFFMDMSFRYDIGVGESERAGVTYLRAAYPLLDLVSEHSRARPQATTPQAGAAPPATPAPAAPTVGAPNQAAPNQAAPNQPAPDQPAPDQVDAAFTRLDAIHQKLAAQLQLAADARRDGPGLTPGRLREAWNRLRATRRPGDTEAMLTAVAGLMGHVGEQARLILDPALDSAYLADAVILALPRTSLLLARLERDALATMPRGGAAPPPSGPQRDQLLKAAGVLEQSLRDTLAKADMALTEDAHYYGTSASLHQRIPPVLERCRTSTLALVGIIDRYATSGVSTDRYLAALREARTAAQALYAAGLDELDALIGQRLASYRAWRYAAILLSAGATAAALLVVFFAMRRIDVDLRRVGEYARRVEAGDYDAAVEGVHGAEARELAHTLRHMVGQMKTKIGYLNGILEGMTVPCLVVDRDERLTFLNRPYLALYERPGEPGDYLGQTLGKFFYGDEHHETITGRCMRSGEPIRNLEVDTTLPSGRAISVRYDVAPLHDLDRELIGAFALIVDLTEVKDQGREIVRLAAFPRENPTPVLSADADGDLIYMNPAAARALADLGADLRRDFLPPDHAEIVAACLSSGQVRRDIESTPGGRVFSWNYNPLPGCGQVHIYAADVTERKRAEEQLLHDAFHDGLTGLPNRALLLDRLGQVLREHAAPEEAPGSPEDVPPEPDPHGFAVLVMDLDHFKNINDSLGHDTGDRLIQELARRMAATLAPGHTLARLGGDEFALLAHPVASAGAALDLAEDLRRQASGPVFLDGYELSTAASVGLVYGGGGRQDAAAVLRDADTAMFRAKAQGRAATVLFDGGMHRHVRERLDLEIAMKKGLEAGEFLPYFQPIVCMRTGRVAGFEALARWQRPGAGLISPGRFIPLAEETGLVVPLGEHMLRTACATARRWNAAHPAAPDAQDGGLSISVNLAVRQMILPSIVDDVAAILEETGIAPALVKIEVTESGIMDNARAARDVLLRLKKLGVALSIDDFGTGYSSLSYLTHFPFDFLKVDQSFVRNMATDADSLEIVRTIVSLAHSLGKQVVAEGIEEQRQYDMLRELGCRYGQGYLFARPLPEPDATALLDRDPSWK